MAAHIVCSMETKLVTHMGGYTVSSLAASLAELELTPKKSVRRAACHSLYGDGDLEDKEAVDRLRDDRISWAQIQTQIDSLLGIKPSKKINVRKFVRHWRGECSCWESQR